jgi:lipopolysaccharide transport system ATP-binding protein
MSDLAISVRGIGKTYRRFTSRFWQAASLLGAPIPGGCFDVFWALENITFEVRPGERVGLIGRNGAGKTTLLRIIAGQASPSCGQIKVAGNVQALMELGTGFHPELSGLENIKTALSLNGHSTRQISAQVEEIIEFTELEDFIRRPVREYSAGMYARLAFAVATSTRPTILIIDEILGAGDAYFIGKCIQRVTELTKEGTTVLFVSHDLGAVQRLCERAIWLHQGALRADGDILGVAKRYQAHIREQEELRLRARSMSLSRAQLSAIGNRPSEHAPALYRLSGPRGEPPTEPCHVQEIRFGANDTTIATIRVGVNDIEGEARLLIDPAVLNWSKAVNLRAARCRAFGDFGGRYQHAPFVMEWPSGSRAARWLELVLLPSVSDPIDVEVYDPEARCYRALAVIPAENSEQWRTIRIALPETAVSRGDQASRPDQPATAADRPRRDVTDAAGLEEEASPEPSTIMLTKADRYGSREIFLVDFALEDADGIQRHTLISGDYAAARLTYEATEAVENPVAVIAIYRPDGTCATQLISRRDGVEFGLISGIGQIIVELDPLFLGPGDYIVSIALFKDLDLMNPIEPAAYDLHDRAYLLQMLPPDGMTCEIGIVNQPGRWRTAPVIQCEPSQPPAGRHLSLISCAR